MDKVSTQLESSLIDTAVESWRFSKVFSKIIKNLDAGESSRYISQLRYFQKKVKSNLELVGLDLVDIEGHLYDPGMAVSALNLGDFEPEDQLIVDQMMEPIIMSLTGIKKEGTVMLKKVNS